MLEDAEYFCVDNLPIPLVEKFAQLTADGTSGEIQKVAVGIDIRSGQALPGPAECSGVDEHQRNLL